MKLRSLLATLLLLIACTLVIAQTPGDESESACCGAEDELEVRYVGVDSSNQDAVILDSSDWLSNPLVGLARNQQVLLLGDTQGDYTKVRTTIRGREYTGWVKEVILVEEPDRAIEGAVASAQSGKSRTDIEPQLRIEYEAYGESARTVDEFVELRNLQLGGDEQNPNPVQMLKRIQDFRAEGGLEPGRSK